MSDVRAFNVPLTHTLGMRHFGPLLLISEPTLATVYPRPPDARRTQAPPAQALVNMPESLNPSDEHAAHHTRWVKPETYGKKDLINETLKLSQDKAPVYHIAAVGQFPTLTDDNDNTKVNFLHTYRANEVAPGMYDRRVEEWATQGCINAATFNLWLNALGHYWRRPFDIAINLPRELGVEARTYLNQQRGQTRAAQADVCCTSVLSGDGSQLPQKSDGTSLELTNTFGARLPITEEQASKRSKAAAQKVDTTFVAGLNERSQRATKH